MLVTGGAGFIGSNFIRWLLRDGDFKGNVVNIDKLTYAGNLKNLADIEAEFGSSRYYFEKEDICDYKRVLESGAVPLRCPRSRCIGILQFIDVTPELFYDED